MDPPAIPKIPIRCPQNTEPSYASAATRGTRTHGPLRNIVGIDSSNVIDYLFSFGRRLVLRLLPEKYLSSLSREILLEIDLMTLT